MIQNEPSKQKMLSSVGDELTVAHFCGGVHEFARTEGVVRTIEKGRKVKRQQQEQVQLQASKMVYFCLILSNFVKNRARSTRSFS